MSTWPQCVPWILMGFNDDPIHGSAGKVHHVFHKLVTDTMGELLMSYSEVNFYIQERKDGLVAVEMEM
eukprot:8934648-Ditylum_brightwellii.AAC.1